jgi:signal transduction histidine kinase/DNA-binding response OmpR family regulator
MPQAPSVLTILLVDNDDIDRMAVRRALRAAGLRADVTEAQSAAEAVQLMRSQAFDCVLLDYGLPDADGLAVLRDARAAGSTVPVIMLTGQGDEELAVEIMKAGASDYLTKSRVSLDHLVQSVRTAVRLHRAEQQRVEAERERDRLLEHERAARAEAEAAQHRLAFLAEASKLLAASLNCEEALAAVARLAVPRIADACAVDMIAGGGGVGGDGASDGPLIQRLALVHVDAEKGRLAGEIFAKYPPRGDERSGVANVLRTGTPELYSQVSEQVLAAVAQHESHLASLRSLELRSLVLVPLESRGEVLGVITLASTLSESGRTFTAADLALAEDLARRAAVAVDNARLYRTLRQAKDAAVAANRAKDQFIAVLSHELRTPLTPVLTTVQDLERDDTLTPDGRVAIQMVRRNVELEAKLIDDLLDLTRISKGKLRLTLGTVDAHALLNSVLEICESDIVSKRQQVKVELTAGRHHLRADSARLHQIFWNLIKNAVKFTPERGRIAVSTRNDEAGNFELQVTDTGIGIEPDVLPRIFDAFEQGEQAVTRQFGGLGLGLAITRALVEGHGGRIRAQSAGRGTGATFSVRLATVAAAPPTTTTTMQPAPAVPKPMLNADVAAPAHLKILLVDDHEDTSRAMKRLLERVGYEVRTASSVAGAMESAKRAPFDLLISDIGLPDGSGIELLRRLKERFQHGRAPLKAIALSGFGMEEDLRRSREAGFVEHLTKPVDFEQLEAVIQQLTGVAAAAASSHAPGQSTMSFSSSPSA